jgi:methanethiol S-methyltransferase
MKYLIIIVLWAAYCALHSYLISISFTNLMKRLLKDFYAYYRVFYIIISFVLLVPLINYSTALDSKVVISYSDPMTIVRYILISGSLLMFFWAFFFNYDSLHFFGVRQILNFRKESEPNQPNEIKKKGLLGIMRHPMYFALIIYLWCQTFRVADIVVNSVLTIYVFIGTILEEKKLVLEFGDAYKIYQKEVPMIIPFTKINI